MIAQVIGDIVSRPADLAVRYGGEEFAVLLPETDQAGAKQIAEKIRQSIADLKIPHAGSTTLGNITVSTGVASAPAANFSDTSELIHQADQCLYQAKSKGRNCTVC